MKFLNNVTALVVQEVAAGRRESWQWAPSAGRDSKNRHSFTVIHSCNSTETLNTVLEWFIYMNNNWLIHVLESKQTKTLIIKLFLINPEIFS